MLVLEVVVVVALVGVVVVALENAIVHRWPFDYNFMQMEMTEMNERVKNEMKNCIRTFVVVCHVGRTLCSWFVAYPNVNRMGIPNSYSHTHTTDSTHSNGM